VSIIPTTNLAVWESTGILGVCIPGGIPSIDLDAIALIHVQTFYQFIFVGSLLLAHLVEELEAKSVAEDGLVNLELVAVTVQIFLWFPFRHHITLAIVLGDVGDEFIALAAPLFLDLCVARPHSVRYVCRDCTPHAGAAVNNASES
jgi:hypothetical protein